MIARLAEIIDKSYCGVPATQNDRNFVNRVTAFTKMATVALAVTSVVLAVFALSAGSVLCTLFLCVVFHDVWKVSDNINKLVNAGCVNNFASQSILNRKYDIAARLTCDSWLIGPITLAAVGCQ